MIVTPSASRAANPCPNGGSGVGFIQPSCLRAESRGNLAAADLELTGDDLAEIDRAAGQVRRSDHAYFCPRCFERPSWTTGNQPDPIDRELQADSFGLILAMQSTLFDPVTMQRSYLGCEQFLSCIALLEGLLPKSDLYPTGSVRLDRIRQLAAASWPENFQSIARLYQTITTPLVERVPEWVRKQSGSAAS